MAGEGGEGREGGERSSEEEEFSEYVEHLKKKYGEGRVERAEDAQPKQDESEVGVLEVHEAADERTEPDDFASYVEYLRRKYESESESEPQDLTLEANVKTNEETDDRTESSTPGDAQREPAERLQAAEPASTSKIEGDAKAEEAPDSSQDQAAGGPEVGAYQHGEHEDRLEQQSARSGTKQEGVSESPEKTNDSPEAASSAQVGVGPKLGEVEGEVWVSQAGGNERAKETETVEGRAEIPQPHEGAPLKADEAVSCQEQRVAAVGAELRQAYLEKSVAPASRLDESEVGAGSKETQGRVEQAEGLGVFSATALRRTDDSTAFEVRLDSLQRAGVTFETDRTYEIKGRIGEVCDFRKMYSPGESYRMAILAPKEYAQSITPGEKYDVRIGSVREISRNEEHLGVFSATAYRIPGSEDRFRFDLLVSSV